MLDISEAVRRTRNRGKSKKGLSYIYYKAYIKSEFWKERRDNKLILKPLCECCGIMAQCVHHETYHRLGKERMSDLRSLCNQCHEDIHFIYNKGKNSKTNLLASFHQLRKEKGVYNFNGK